MTLVFTAGCGFAAQAVRQRLISPTANSWTLAFELIEVFPRLFGFLLAGLETRTEVSLIVGVPLGLGLQRADGLLVFSVGIEGFLLGLGLDGNLAVQSDDSGVLDAHQEQSYQGDDYCGCDGFHYVSALRPRNLMISSRIAVPPMKPIAPPAPTERLDGHNDAAGRQAEFAAHQRFKQHSPLVRFLALIEHTKHRDGCGHDCPLP